MTVLEFFKSLPNKNNDAKWLIQHYTNTQYCDWASTDLTDAMQKNILEGLSRLNQNEPLAYIIGSQPFLDCDILVTPQVLIPRSETEQLCDIIARDVFNKSVLDMCTGSGCIAIALAKKGALVTAGDISLEALSIAKLNAHNNEVNIDFVHTDMFENILGTFDIIVSNPPYITAEEMQTLDKSVVDYEPHLALLGGVDGLDFYRTIAQQGLKHLNKCGVIYLEVGDKQANQVVDIFNSNYDCEIIKDYFGIDRFVKARRK